MQDYYKVDVKKFLKDSGKWKRKITELNKLLESGEYQRGIPSEDGKITRTMDKSEINHEIEKLQEYERLKSRAVTFVTQEELDCLEVFFGKLEERTDSKDDNDQIQITDTKKNEHTNTPVLESIADAMKKYGYGSKQAVYDRYYHGMEKVSDFLNNNFYYDSLADYYHFDVNEFLKDASSWKKEIKKKKLQLSYDRSLRSIPPDSIGGRQLGSKSDPTLQEVIANDEINADIAKYERYICVFKDAVDKLNKKPPQSENDESYAVMPTKNTLKYDLIYMMFLPDGKNKYRTKNVRIEELAIKHAVSVTVAERALRNAKKEIRNYIEKTYFEEA